VSEMLMLSGLEAQSEISQLLDEIFGDLDRASLDEAGRGERCTPRWGIRHLRVVQGGAQQRARGGAGKPDAVS
jgi:hypothetical protein